MTACMCVYDGVFKGGGGETEMFWGQQKLCGLQGWAK